MTRIDRSALLPYSAQQMYDLVNDVGAYPTFIDGCVASEVLSQSDTEMLAELCLAKAGVEQSFTTRNRLRAPDLIKLQLQEGPFERFAGEWRFLRLNDTACKVSFSLQFEMASGVLGVAAKPLFTGMADTLVDTMVKRAKEVYGR